MRCEVNGCERDARTKKQGNLCLMHYKRFIRHGSTELPEVNSYKNEKCNYCDRTVGEKGGGARGMCSRHYQNWTRHKDPLHADKIKSQLGSRGYKKRLSGKDLHRKIVEDNIGRELSRDEIVHHIDCDKTNNAIENLHVCKGQSEHQLLHRQLERIAGEFVRRGLIVFEDGNYRANC